MEGEKLTDREVLLTTVTLILAGIESLSGFMTMFALNMSDHPDARAKLVANPALTADAIEESLRFNTSAQRFRRCLTRDVELHGQTMKAGDFVCMAYGSGNRDERRFPNPDVYDIARKPRGHLGFGSGVHTCLGTQIGRLATRVLFETMHARLPVYERVDRAVEVDALDDVPQPAAAGAARGVKALGHSVDGRPSPTMTRRLLRRAGRHASAQADHPQISARRSETRARDLLDELAAHGVREHLELFAGTRNEPGPPITSFL